MKCKHTHFSILFILAFLMSNSLQAAINDRYTLVTSADELADGDEFIIVDKSFKQTVGKYIASKSSARFESCSVTLEGNDAIISSTNATIFVLENKGENSYIKTQLEGEYLSGNSKDVGIQLLTSINSNNQDLCKVTFNFESNHKIEIGNKRYKHFWCNSKNEETYVWKIYDGTATSSTTYIYKKSGNATSVDITLDGLNAEAKNVEALNGYEGKIVDQITINRSFTADGGWYTLCLPFALTADDIKTTFKDALFNEFESVSVNDQGVAQLKFKKVTEAKAGVPYMVLPRGTTVEKPVFNNKTIEKTTPQIITRTCEASDGGTLSYKFIGVYDPTVVSSENNVRFVGGNQGTELLIPDGKGTIKGLRAYFVFPNSSEGIITQAKLNIDDDSTTGIISINAINANHSNETNIYTLSGQQVSKNQKTLKPGIYIKHGKKIMVR